jgi:hypothetical protein
VGQCLQQDYLDKTHMADVKRPVYKSEKMSSRADPIKNAISLIGEQRKLSEGRKSSFDIIGKIAGQSNASLGGSTRGWRSVASGFTQGLQNAAELGSIFENEKLYKEHKNVIDSITAINDQTLVDNEKHRRDEKGRAAVIPDYWGFESMIDRGADGQTLLNSANAMRIKFEEITGEKISPFVRGFNDSKRDFLDEEGNVKNITAMIFGKEYSDNRMSSIDPDHQMQLQEKRQQYQEKQALEERKVGSLENVNDARRRKYEAEIDFMPDKIEGIKKGHDNAELRIKEMGAKRVQAARKYYVPQIDASTEVLKASNLINEIVEETPQALQTVLSLPWQSGDMNLVSSTLKSAIQGMNPEVANAAQKLEKELNKLRLSVVKGISNPNKMLDAVGIGSVPNLQMSPEAFISVMNDIEESARYKYDLNIGELDSVMQIYGSEGEPLSKNVIEKSEQYLNGSDVVSLEDPITGEIGQYDINDPSIDIAIQNGARPVR